jgi:hypothetical protein
MEVMESLDRDTVAKAFSRFRSSSEAVVAADVLTAISLINSILNMFLCSCVLILMKSDDFQLCCVIF